MWHDCDGDCIGMPCRKMAKIKGHGLKKSNFTLISCYHLFRNLSEPNWKRRCLEDVLGMAERGLWTWHGAGRKFPLPVLKDGEV